jgi:hypothetical protein
MGDPRQNMDTYRPFMSTVLGAVAHCVGCVFQEVVVCACLCDVYACVGESQSHTTASALVNCCRKERCCAI